MKGFLVKRLLISIVLVWVVATLVFFSLHMLPGDPALIALGGSEANPDPEALAAMQKKLGLDRPILVQYTDWMGKAIRGDLGKSLLNDRPVGPDLQLRLGRTLQLIIPATILAILVGIPMGVFAATHRSSFLDPLLSSTALLGFSVPVFVLGLLFVWLFGLRLQILPASGYVAFKTDPIGFIKYLTLPAITLSFGMLATVMRMTRSCVLEQLGADYVRTARSKGLAYKIVLYKHALRNALLPVSTVVALQIGLMFGGSVLVESVYNWPGINSFLITSINLRDYPVVQGVLLLISMLFIGINLIADVTYGLLDPKVRLD
ncbi:MAG: ABC transporter permease [Eubacteriales bacterium]|nr:ABC transporter permease [Prolixibacteraceae bacterium]MDD4658307.1 ABC transporter permease [Eubacteriales bacterium]